MVSRKIFGFLGKTCGIVVMAFIATCESALACPVCYGANDSPMTAGMNIAIFALLGVTGSVFAGVVSFYFYMRKRSKMTLHGVVDPPSLN